jgi:hypothetical protein
LQVADSLVPYPVYSRPSSHSIHTCHAPLLHRLRPALSLKSQPMIPGAHGLYSLTPILIPSDGFIICMYIYHSSFFIISSELRNFRVPCASQVSPWAATIGTVDDSFFTFSFHLENPLRSCGINGWKWISIMNSVTFLFFCLFVGLSIICFSPFLLGCC